MFKRIKQIWKQAKKRITVYDFLIIILVLGFLFFLRFYFRQKPTWVGVELKMSSPHWWAEDTVPPYWLADSIDVGDEELGFFNKKVAEVKDIRVFETTEEVKEVYLSLDLRANYNSKTEKYNFKGQAVEIGSALELHLDDVFVQGLVTAISSEEDKTKEVVITGEVENKYPWQVENIDVGEQMKDGQERVVAEVLEKELFLADYLTTDWQGNLYLKKRPDKRDGIFKIRIKVDEIGDNYYFVNEQKVKIGEQLFLQFENSELDYLNIIDIEE
jgi:hypothetical protein